MVATFYPEYQLAAAHNNAAGLAAIEGVLPAGETRPFIAPTVRTGYTQGQLIIRGDGSGTFAGFPAVVWTFSWITFAQREYLRTTYCGAGWTGQVTVRTRLTAGGAYANYNATMLLPQPSEGDEQLGRVANYRARFIRMVAI